MTGHGEQVRSLAVAPDGTIASGDLSGEIRLWDGRDGRFLRTLARQGTVVGSLSFSPDGRRLLSGSCAAKMVHTARMVSTTPPAGGRSRDIPAMTISCTATAFSPDGRWAATGGGDNNEIHLWDPATGARRPGPGSVSGASEDGAALMTLGGTGRPVWAVGVSADGQRIGWGNQVQ